MRRLVGGVLAVVALAALVAGGAVLGGSGVAPGEEAPPGVDEGPSLDVRWVSDTGRDVGGNHHAPAAGRVDGRGFVFAPVSAGHRSEGCALVGLDAADGAARWHHRIPAANCTIHAVGDPGLDDVDGDGRPELLAATTERRVIAADPATGSVEAEAELATYGYARPEVADLTGGPAPEVVVADARGTVSVLDSDWTRRWTREFSSFTYGRPAVADFDADGEAELAVAPGQSGVVLLDGDGSTAWTASDPFDATVTWTTVADLDDDPAVEVVAATQGGTVAAVDGRDGSVEWRRTFGDLAAVNAVGDGDDDGTVEVYAVAGDGRLRALAGPDGRVEWTTELATNPRMTPPPALGDVTGDGDPDLVAPTNDGRVLLVDPADGTVLDATRRDAAVFTHPTLADVDGDGVDEAFVMYGDGRVVALSGEEG